MLKLNITEDKQGLVWYWSTKILGGGGVVGGGYVYHSEKGGEIWIFRKYSYVSVFGEESYMYALQIMKTDRVGYIYGGRYATGGGGQGRGNIVGRRQKKRKLGILFWKIVVESGVCGNVSNKNEIT